MAATSHELDYIRVLAGRDSEVVYRDDVTLQVFRNVVRFLTDDGYLEKTEDGQALVPTEKAHRMMDVELEEDIRSKLGK